MADLELRIKSLDAAVAEGRLNALDTAAKSVENSVNSLAAATKTLAKAQKAQSAASGASAAKMAAQQEKAAAAVRKRNQTIAEQSKEIAKLSRQIDRAAKSEQKLKQVQEGATSSAKAQAAAEKNRAKVLAKNIRLLEQTGKRVGLLSAALAAIAIRVAIDQFAKGIKTFTGFETAMKFIEIRSKATASELVKLSSQARALGSSTVFTATEVAGAQKQLVSAGLSVNKVLKATPQLLNFARVAELEFARAASLALDSVNQFSLGLAALPRVADGLTKGAFLAKTEVGELGQALSFVGPVAAASNIGFEETTATLTALASVGLRASKSGVALRGILKSLSDPSKEAAIEFKVLAKISGQSEDAFRIQKVGLVGVLEALKRSKAPAESYFKIFQTRSVPAAQALTRLTGKITENAEKIKNSNGEVADAAKKLESLTASSIANMISAWEDLQITIGSGLKGPVDAAIAFITDLVKSFTALFTQAETGQGSMRGLARSILAVVGALISMAAVGVIGGIITLVRSLRLVALAIQAIKIALVSTGIGAVIVILGTLAAAFLPEILSFFGLLDSSAQELNKDLKETAKLAKELENTKLGDKDAFGTSSPEEQARAKLIADERATIKAADKKGGGGGTDPRKQALEALIAKEQAVADRIRTAALGEQAKAQQKVLDNARLAKKFLGVKGSIFGESLEVQEEFNSILEHFKLLEARADRAEDQGQRLNDLVTARAALTEDLVRGQGRVNAMAEGSAIDESTRQLREMRNELAGPIEQALKNDEAALQSMVETLDDMIARQQEVTDDLTLTEQARERQLVVLQNQIDLLSDEVEHQRETLEFSTELEEAHKRINQILADRTVDQEIKASQDLTFALREQLRISQDRNSLDEEAIDRINEARDLWDAAKRAREELLAAARSEGVELDRNSQRWRTIVENVETARSLVAAIVRENLPAYFSQVAAELQSIALQDSLDLGDISRAKSLVKDLQEQLNKAPPGDIGIVAQLREAERLLELIQLKLKNQDALNAIKGLGEEVTSSIGGALMDITFSTEKLSDIFDDLIKKIISAAFQKLVLDQVFGFVNAGIAAGAGALLNGASAGAAGASAGAAAGAISSVAFRSGTLPVAAARSTNPFLLASRNRSTGNSSIATVSSEGGVTVVQNISTPDATSFRRSQPQLRTDAIRSYKGTL